MNILVVSDSHGHDADVEAAIEKANAQFGKIDAMIHLGDVGANYPGVSNMAHVPTYMACGNCDYPNETLRNILVLHFGGHKIFAVHGHRQGVNMDLSTLRYNALENDCDIALFGHTHVPFAEINENDVSFLNPGSVSLPRGGSKLRSYAVIQIDDFDDLSISFGNLENDEIESVE